MKKKKSEDKIFTKKVAEATNYVSVAYLTFCPRDNTSKVPVIRYQELK